MTSSASDTDYSSIAAMHAALVDGETDDVALYATTCALLNDELHDINWVGFYLLRGDTLVVGPFQGKPACIRIALGRGVCGTAAERRETIVVPDVNAFDGHIACDARSRSEVVVPLVVNGDVVGVLDVDSPSLNRFDESDARGLERVVAQLVERLSA